MNNLWRTRSCQRWDQPDPEQHLLPNFYASHNTRQGSNGQNEEVIIVTKDQIDNFTQGLLHMVNNADECTGSDKIAVQLEYF